MGATGAIYVMAAFAVVNLAIVALPLARVRRWWPLFWRLSYESQPRPASAMQVIAAWAGGVFAVLVVVLITWHASQDLAPEEAAAPEHYVSLGLILGVSLALLVAVLWHQRRRRRGAIAEPPGDAEINEAADRARVPGLSLPAIAAAVGLALLIPWANDIERVPGATHEERTARVAGLEDLITIAPARVDDLGDGRIRINYLGYRVPECDLLAGALVDESTDTVEVSVQLGHPRTSGGCNLARSLLLSGNLDHVVQFYFEQQLESPLGNRTVVLTP